MKQFRLRTQVEKNYFSHIKECVAVYLSHRFYHILLRCLSVPLAGTS